MAGTGLIFSPSNQVNMGFTSNIQPFLKIEQTPLSVGFMAGIGPKVSESTAFILVGGVEMTTMKVTAMKDPKAFVDLVNQNSANEEI